MGRVKIFIRKGVVNLFKFLFKDLVEILEFFFVRYERDDLELKGLSLVVIS